MLNKQQNQKMKGDFAMKLPALAKEPIVQFSGTLSIYFALQAIFKDSGATFLSVLSVIEVACLILITRRVEDRVHKTFAYATISFIVLLTIYFALQMFHII